MKLYHIYYLPNAIRTYIDGTIVYGKVGFSSLTPELRKRTNKNGNKKVKPLNVEGHVVLVNGITDKVEAKRYETRYQQILRCCEPNIGFKGKTHKQESKSKMSNLGRTHSDETKEKMRQSHLGKKRK
jgi:hypothetical protein